MKCRKQHLKQAAVRRCAGMTLTDVMVATGIAFIVFAAVASLSMYTARSFAAMGNYADLDNASRNALDTMSRDIRQCQSMNAFSPTQLTFTDCDTNTLTFTYDSSARTLTKVDNGLTNVLLYQCDYLNFDISKRNPSNSFTFYSTTNASEAKLVDVSWRCSRQILGAAVNTESVQTAKIVIRN
jgi:hypothetical protein